MEQIWGTAASCKMTCRGHGLALWGCCTKGQGWGEGKRNPKWKLMGCLFQGRIIIFFNFFLFGNPLWFSSCCKGSYPVGNWAVVHHLHLGCSLQRLLQACFTCSGVPKARVHLLCRSWRGSSGTFPQSHHPNPPASAVGALPPCVHSALSFG